MPERAEPLDVDTVVLDVDGTLVDSVYVHVAAWMRAFRGIGVPVEAWRLHRSIGMGGDRFVTEVAGQRVEDAVGDQARELHDREYDDLFAAVLPMPGADELLRNLKDRGFTVVLASSGTKTQTEEAMSLLENASLVDGWVCSEDVDASKPAPDLVGTAIERVDGGRAVMLGDAVWDVKAAAAAGVPAIGLLCGGFGESELRAAGAVAVFDSPEDLLERFDASGLPGRVG
jgi:HAD superfamily hydrolase (TIGR01549 family)